MITINKELLESFGACEPGVEWFAENYDSATFESAEDVRTFIENLNWQKLKYANWLLCRLLTPKQCVAYANNAAIEAIKAAKTAEWAARTAYWSAKAAKAAEWAVEWAAETKRLARIIKIVRTTNTYKVAIAAQWAAEWAAWGVDNYEVALSELIIFGAKLYFKEEL